MQPATTADCPLRSRGAGVFIQWCALIWYIASFIPYGQTMIKKFFKSVGNFE